MFWAIDKPSVMPRRPGPFSGAVGSCVLSIGPGGAAGPLSRTVITHSVAVSAT
jgi:hypothetical protein